MAGEKPFDFTLVSYIINKSGDGSVRCREEILFEQVPSPKGTFVYRPVKRTVLMPEEEQMEADKKMMKQVGETLSEYYACHPEKET